MFRFIQTILLLFAFSLTPLFLHATHNRAGEIRVEQIGPLTVRATIVTWTKTSSSNVDRDTLTICWGDGFCEQVPRANGDGFELPNDIKYNEYIAEHTYVGPSTYTISMTDQNRNAGIVNVNPPASENIPFHIQTTYKFIDPQFGGGNSTPELLQPPIDVACVGQLFKHNPNAFDPDKDSLSYQLIVPLQGIGTQVPNYSFPNQISPGSDNLISLDERTGDFIWVTPQAPGEYNVAIIIVSWRNGQPIDTTIRDMQILVTQCNNRPPQVTVQDEFCVVAGETLLIEAVANDPDTHAVQLTALGGPLSSPYSPAQFTASLDFTSPPVTGLFEWHTTCEHIARQPYTVVFRAVDSAGLGIPRLSDLKTVNIKVVGPPPLDVRAVAQSATVEVSWEKPYVCEAAAENYFYGFSVWRREGSNPFPYDSCRTGLAGRGYTELTFVTKQVRNGRYFFEDLTAEPGRTYCYRVIAKFAGVSAGGYPYNIVESLPSEETCVQLPRDLPLITHVSVEQTASAAGQMKVCWSKPVAADLDTVTNHGPYRYQVLRADGFSGGVMNPVPGGDFTADAFWLANDTCFIDQNLNTAGGPYHYEVAFYVKGESTPRGNSNAASSVYLSAAPTDQTALLSWQEIVPWGNYRYDIYRYNESAAAFELIGTTVEPHYDDAGLENGKNYCYKVQSVGTYGVGGLASPLLNWSQETCVIPIDNRPPCAPQLSLNNRCNTGESVAPPDPPYENLLIWIAPLDLCGDEDVIRYRLWYAPDSASAFEVVAEVNDPDSLQYFHSPAVGGLQGCYYVTAIDSVGNESLTGNTVCAQNCPEYQLPNAFTPNGDGDNDLFTPFPNWRFVDRVDMRIYNRWGNLVFDTADPNINWTGMSADGKTVADGTYYYTCKVYIDQAGGIPLQIATLSGYIEVFSGM